MWTFQNEKASYICSNKSRGYEVIEETIGKEYNGVWVSDRNNAQIKQDCAHQYCISHILRDCNYAIEADKTRFPMELKKILKKAMLFKKRYGDEYNPNKRDIFREKERYKKFYY